jgi:NhaP-type Na+/H+ and K+/H+ antiporter
MQLTQKKEKQSRLFLTFLDKQTEKKYLEYYNANAILQSKIASSLGILMYLTFIILDYFISAPGEFIIYFITRMIVSFGPLLIANIIAFSPRFNQNTSSLEYFTVFALLSAQCGHYILMYFTSSSPFYDLGV